MENNRILAKGLGTNMKEADYQNMANTEGIWRLTDDEARNLIGEKLGFDPLRVKIIHEVSDYRKAGNYWEKWHTYHRDPLYYSDDWNYFRFNVCGQQYEYVGGRLNLYNI